MKLSKIALSGVAFVLSLTIGKAFAYSGEDLLSGRPFHHFDITYRALAGDRAITADEMQQVFPGLGFSREAATAIAWHADFIDAYLYSPIFWAQGVPDGYDKRLKASLAQFDELAKLHFDDTFSSAGIESTWVRYGSGTLAGLFWAADNNDHAAAYNILGVSVHAVQDFYSHSNWVDDPERRKGAWHEMLAADRAKHTLYSGAYELPATTAPASHGKVSFECSLFGRPEIAPVMEQVCTGLTPFAEAPQCQSYRRYCRGGQATKISLEGASAEALVLAPPGIALDNSWLAKVGGNVRGLTTAEGNFAPGRTDGWLSLAQCNAVANLGVACNEETPSAGACQKIQPRACSSDADRLFATSKFLAIESTTQWVAVLDAIMKQRHGKFWAEVKQGMNSSVAQREQQFEDFDKLPFQFLSAGDYPVQGSESDGYYIRLRLRTADSQGAGTDADISARVEYPGGSKEFKLDYMPTDKDAGLRSNRLLVYNDFEKGDNDVYTIGPFPQRPTWLTLINDAADGGEVLEALGEQIYESIVSIFTDPEETFLPLISGEADYVGETTVRLSYAQLSEAANGAVQKLNIDAAKDGDYDLQYSLSSTTNGLTEEQRSRGWKRFTLNVQTLKCNAESQWDRSSDSDEPFFFFSASPLNGASNATQYYRQEPLEDVDTGESVTLSSQPMSFDLSPEGVLVLAFQLYEHDEESKDSRDSLFNVFKTGVDDSADSANSKFLDELGRSLAASWTVGEIDAYGFSRGARVDVGNILNVRGPIEIGGDEARRFQLFPARLYVAAVPEWPSSPANWRAPRRYANFAPSLRQTQSAVGLRRLTTIPAPNARIQIRVASTGKCVGVAGESVALGVAIEQQTCRTGAQKWVLNAAGADSFLIIAPHSFTAAPAGPKCMLPAGQDVSDGTAILHQACTVQVDRLWRLEPVNNGFRLRFGRLGKCLEVQNGSTADGARLQLATCVDGRQSQLFELFGD
ncbi:RICIN domain-containing protein [Hyphococcus sp.]|uniref:RICIN domain-containing protein n=1 Tax=Hyphococcus sp. TaxID=2038636 RepID=UPI0035C6D1BE